MKEKRNWFVSAPVFEVHQLKVKVYSSPVYDGISKGETSYFMRVRNLVPLCGDIKVEFFNKTLMMKKEKMLHFWFNTFFVRETAAPSSIPVNGAGLHGNPQELLVLTIPKMDLDRANKDKSHKFFSPNFKIRVFFLPMKEMEQNLERSKSADDVVADKYRRRDDFSHQTRSHTSERLYVSPQKSPQTPTHLTRNHALEDRYHLAPGFHHFVQPPPPRRDGMVNDSNSLGESVEGISISGSSDNDGVEDDLSDTETDNEWEGCEVTLV